MVLAKLVVASCLLSIVAASCGADADATCGAQADGGDSASLVQKTIALKASVDASRTQASCQCQSWAEMYNENKMVCGQGLEFFNFAYGDPEFKGLAADDPALHSMRHIQGDWPEEFFCRGFLHKLKSNVCVGKFYELPADQADASFAGSWCYVSAECQDLHGGAQIPDTTFSWKTCQEDQDVMLDKMKPSDIVELAHEQDLSLSLLLEYSAFYVDKDPAELTGDELQKMKDTGKSHYIWPNTDPAASRLLVSGDEEWKVEWSDAIVPPGFNPKHEQRANFGKEKKPAGNYPYGQWLASTCQKGCPRNLRDQVETWESRSESLMEKKDSCTCLPWDKVYSEKNVTCGQGMELFAQFVDSKREPWGAMNKGVALFDQGLIGSDGKSTPGKVFCEEFFQKLNFGYCVNEAFQLPANEAFVASGSWCYVSKECKAAKPVEGSDVSLKTCQRGKDRHLDDLKPAELFAFSLKTGVDPSWSASYAYQTIDRPSEACSEEEKQTSECGKFPRFKLSKDELANIRKSGKTTFVLDKKLYRYSVVDKSLFEKAAIVSADDVWEMEYNFAIKSGTPRGWLDRKHQFETKCIEGCKH